MGKSAVVNGHSQDESMVELLLRAVSPDPSLTPLWILNHT